MGLCAGISLRLPSHLFKQIGTHKTLSHLLLKLLTIQTTKLLKISILVGHMYRFRILFILSNPYGHTYPYPYPTADILVLCNVI